MEYQRQHSSPQRLFRAAILNGNEPCPQVVAQLEAIGINTGELATRLRQQMQVNG